MIPLLYRTAAVLLALFALGHTIGFARTQPGWNVDTPINALKATTFQVNGFTRTYWGFYLGFGYFATLFLLFAALVAWQLGGFTPDRLALVSSISWALALCSVGVTVLSWKYFFVAPGVFSTLVSVCLVLAAWMGSSPR